MKKEQKNIPFKFREVQGEIQEYFPHESMFNGRDIQIIGKIGEGPHTWTFRSTVDGYPTTIKIIDEQHLTQGQEGISRHVEALKRLDHPRIGRVTDFFYDEDKKRSYVFMEYINGVSLDKALIEQWRGTFSQNLVLEWGCQLLDALSYLHQHFTRGNVKLSNIVRRRDNSACLSDFSYLVGESEDDLLVDTNNPDEMDFMETADFFGTPKDPVTFQRDVQRDIYRLGDVLFHLLTGEGAVKGETIDEKRDRLTEKGVFLSVANVIVKALSENPEDRWQSAEEMKNALLAIPLRDSRRRRYTRNIIVQFSLILIAAVAGLGLFRAGHSMERRAVEMSELTASALSQWQAGDYTAAYASVSGSLEKRFPDPGCTPETLRAAAEILGVYDYASGFRPVYSTAQTGEPLFCTVAPGGTRLAVLTEETLGLSGSARFLHILDARSGKECAAPVEISLDAVPCVDFLDDNTLLYVNRDGRLAMRGLDKDKEDDLDAAGTSVRRFTLSWDRKVVAFLGGDSADELTAYVSQISDNSDFSPEKSVSLNQAEYVFSSEEGQPENCLFALNRDGSRLTASLMDRQGVGLVRVYSFPKPGEPDDAQWEDILIDHPYTHYEGGFFGEYLAFTGWAETPYYRSRVSVYDLSDSGEGGVRSPLITRPLFERTCASVDETGIYFSVDNSLNSLSVDPLFWNPSISLDGSITALRHTAESVLALTDSGKAYICDADGSGLRQVFDNAALSCAALSDGYLLFCDRSKTAVQIWTDGAESAVRRMEYEEGYPHLLFNVTADRSSAMLYGGADLFRVYGADGSLLGGGTSDSGVRGLKYLRAPEWSTEPDEECLRVEYQNRTAYYAAADGALLSEQGAVSGGGILTEDYRLVSQADGYVVIYRRDSGVPLRSIETAGRLVEAFQADGKNYLLISLLSDDDQPTSLLLNRDLDVIAALPGAFTILEDGTLYYDDQAGTLLEGQIYDREALAVAAEQIYARAERVDGP